MRKAKQKKQNIETIQVPVQVPFGRVVQYFFDWTDDEYKSWGKKDLSIDDISILTKNGKKKVCPWNPPWSHPKARQIGF